MHLKCQIHDIYLFISESHNSDGWCTSQDQQEKVDLLLIPQEDRLRLNVGPGVDPVQLVGHPEGVKDKEYDEANTWY